MFGLACITLPSGACDGVTRLRLHSRHGLSINCLPGLRWNHRSSRWVLWMRREVADEIEDTVVCRSFRSAAPTLSDGAGHLPPHDRLRDGNLRPSREDTDLSIEMRRLDRRNGHRCGVGIARSPDGFIRQAPGCFQQGAPSQVPIAGTYSAGLFSSPAIPILSRPIPARTAAAVVTTPASGPNPPPVSQSGPVAA